MDLSVIPSIVLVWVSVLPDSRSDTIRLTLRMPTIPSDLEILEAPAVQADRHFPLVPVVLYVLEVLPDNYRCTNQVPHSLTFVGIT